MTTVQGVIHGRTIELQEAADLPDGQVVTVIVTPVGPRGSSAAVLAAAEAEPHVPAEWVDELEQLITPGPASTGETGFVPGRDLQPGHPIMPAALLDTNAVSDLMRDHAKVKAGVANHSETIITSAVVAGEIRYGLSRLPAGKKRSDLEARAHRILAAVRVEPVTELIADVYGLLKATLESQGLNLDDNDLWIAATALATGSLLVTRDQIFARISGLQVADWSL